MLVLLLSSTTDTVFPPYGMDQTHARKGLVQRQAWHASDEGTSPELACELLVADVPRPRQARPSSARLRTRAHKENMRVLVVSSYLAAPWCASL